MDTKPIIAPVEIINYDPAWTTLFLNEKEEISQAIGQYVMSIEHIGSTSIVNMPAKPEIDILVGLAHLTDAAQCINPLAQIGYPYYQRFEATSPERRYFRKSEGVQPLVHIHMVEQTSDFYQGRIAFRDYMRSHPEVAAQYAAIKQNLVKKFGGDRLKYSEEKSSFVAQILTQLGHDPDRKVSETPKIV